MSSFLYAGVARGQQSTQPDRINQNAGTFSPVVDAGQVVTDLTTVSTQGTTVATDAATEVTNWGSSLTSVNTLITAIGSGAGSADAAALKVILQLGSTDAATLSTDVTTLQTDISTSQAAANAVVTDMGNLDDLTVVVNLNKGMLRRDVKNGADAINRWLLDGRSLLNCYITP